MIMLDVAKLESDVQKKLDSWDEKSQFTLAGVNNLSFSDMEMLLSCCELYKIDYPLDHLILSDSLRTVLNKYNE